MTGAIEARIGALITAPSGTTVPAGYGKLSASLDEFRVWKDRRTSEEVGRNWFTNIYGGTNTKPKKLVETGLQTFMVEQTQQPKKLVNLLVTPI